MKKLSLLFIPVLVLTFALLGIKTAYAVADTTPPVAPEIVFPNSEQYFNTTPILNDWNAVSDDSGIAYYRIEYDYDDGHTFSGAPYRTTTDTQRNHAPGTWEQGGVRIRVQAFDNAGNEGAWSEWRHYFYDATAPVVPSGIYFKDTDNNKTILCSGVTNTKHLDVYWNAIAGDPSFSHYEYSSFNAPSGSAGLVQKIFYTNYFNSSFWTIPIEGTYGVQLRSVDLAGNKSSWYGGTVGINNSCKFIVDWTAPDVEINNPVEGIVSGIVDIKGTVTDLHPHHYWLAIYSGGTQIAGPGTVNRNDSFSNESLMMWDTTLLPDGVYIIKLEARDAANNKDLGSSDWHTVTVDNDSDNDGVLNTYDYCSNTSPDETLLGLGINRHVWYGGEDFTTLVNKKGFATEKDSAFSMADTHGCSCEQILDRLVLATEDSFGGHYKFGCSKSIIEDWIDGKYWIEKVTVPAINSEEKLSTHN